MRCGNVREVADELIFPPAPPTVRDSCLAGCLHVCLQLQVSPGCVFIELHRHMFPQAQVERFIMCSSLITTLPDLIKARTEAGALKHIIQSVTSENSSQADVRRVHLENLM